MSVPDAGFNDMDRILVIDREALTKSATNGERYKLMLKTGRKT